MKTDYKHAPVFEVIIGACYNTPIISVNSVLKNAMLCEEFPTIEINPPLTIEILEGFNLVPVLNQDGGPFLVRRRSADRKWLVQIQANAAYVNWIRPDTDPDVQYVGFDAVKEKFFLVASVLENSLGISLQSDMAFCELTYLDRFPWKAEIPELSQLDKLMSVRTPPKFSEYGYNNVSSRFTFHDPKTQGFGVISINTTASVRGEQLLRVETTLRGNPAGDFKEWLRRAHEKQHDIFKDLFKEELRNKWK